MDHRALPPTARPVPGRIFTMVYLAAAIQMMDNILVIELMP
jgi:hypothetical protein